MWTDRHRSRESARCRRQRENPRDSGKVERLVDTLQEIPLSAWRVAALAAFHSPEAVAARAALSLVVVLAPGVRRWHLLDDLATALHRLRTREALGIVQGRELNQLREATERAIDALLCESFLDHTHVATLTGPFLALMRVRIEA